MTRTRRRTEAELLASSAQEAGYGAVIPAEMSLPIPEEPETTSPFRNSNRSTPVTDRELEEANQSEPLEPPGGPQDPEDQHEGNEERDVNSTVLDDSFTTGDSEPEEEAPPPENEPREPEDSPQGIQALAVAQEEQTPGHTRERTAPTLGLSRLFQESLDSESSRAQARTTPPSSTSYASVSMGAENSVPIPDAPARQESLSRIITVSPPSHEVRGCPQYTSMEGHRLEHWLSERAIEEEERRRREQEHQDQVIAVRMHLDWNLGLEEKTSENAQAVMASQGESTTSTQSPLASPAVRPDVLPREATLRTLGTSPTLPVRTTTCKVESADEEESVSSITDEVRMIRDHPQRRCSRQTRQVSLTAWKIPARYDFIFLSTQEQERCPRRKHTPGGQREE